MSLVVEKQQRLSFPRKEEEENEEEDIAFHTALEPEEEEEEVEMRNHSGILPPPNPPQPLQEKTADMNYHSENDGVLVLEQSVSFSEDSEFTQQQQQQQQQEAHEEEQPHNTGSDDSDNFDNDEKSEAYPAAPTLYTFSNNTFIGRILRLISERFVSPEYVPIYSGSALVGFLSLLLVTCSSYMVSPMRDAAALAIGVNHIPALTLASTLLAFTSSVPVGWLFEAPDPNRQGGVWNRIGMTRGETQGTSLALFYRCFAFLLVSYSIGFKAMELLHVSSHAHHPPPHQQPIATDIQQNNNNNNNNNNTLSFNHFISFISGSFLIIKFTLSKIVNSQIAKLFYVGFFLVVHLMKLHALSLLWGVASEALEYEEHAEQRRQQQQQQQRRYTTGEKAEDDFDVFVKPTTTSTTKREKKSANSTFSRVASKKGGKQSQTRLKRLAFVGFGGTLGGILGSIIASVAAHILHLSGLLLLAAIFLELSAELSVELGRIMHRHWKEEQQLAILAIEENDEDDDNHQGVDSSLKRVSSLGSMKRIASGNSLAQLSALRRAKSVASLNETTTTAGDDNNNNSHKVSKTRKRTNTVTKTTKTRPPPPEVDENSFQQRLLRGVTTILRSRLLMAIFIYNALYATTTVLLSFQRAELVANRSASNNSSSRESDTAFLAKINIASSVATFALQASGAGAYIANACGQRGTLALMPLIRLGGVFLLAWWHVKGAGRPPNLTLFLVLDEFTKVINLAVAKPVRESLWSGLSNEARYEAKPIVDTLANRWGGGSAAFLTSLLDRIMDFLNLGEVSVEDGRTKTLFGFPPVLILCIIAAVWWTVVSGDLGNIRRRIDLELKKKK